MIIDKIKEDSKIYAKRTNEQKVQLLEAIVETTYHSKDISDEIAYDKNIIRVLSDGVLAQDEDQWKNKCMEKFCQWLNGRTVKVNYTSISSESGTDEISVNIMGSIQNRLIAYIADEDRNKLTEDQVKEFEIVPLNPINIINYKNYVEEYEDENGELISGNPDREFENQLIKQYNNIINGC